MYDIQSYTRVATVPSVWYLMLYSQRTVRTRHSSAEANLTVSLIWSVCTSQLSHGFYSAWDRPLAVYVYFLGLRPRKSIQLSRGTSPIHCKKHETTITCTCIYIHVHLCYERPHQERVN